MLHHFTNQNEINILNNANPSIIPSEHSNVYTYRFNTLAS